MLIMRYVFIFALIAACLSIESRDEILLLNNLNFKEALHTYENLVVFFTRLEEEDLEEPLEETREWKSYRKIYKQLQELAVPFQMAYVDANEPDNADLLEKYQVTTMGNEIFLFKKQGQYFTKTNRKSVRSEKKVKEWFENKVVVSAQDVSCSKIPSLLQEVTNKRMLVYYSQGEDKPGHPIFEVLNFTPVGQNFQIFHLQEEECAKKYGAEQQGTFILFRHFDENPAVYTGDVMDIKALQEWIWENSIPEILEVNEGNFDLLMNQKKPIVIAFKRVKRSEKFDLFEKLVPEYKNEFFFAISDNKERDEKDLAKYLGADLDQIIIFEPQTMNKYKLETKGFEVERVRDFFNSYKAKTITPYQKSQRSGSKLADKSPTLTLTGNNHDQLISDANGDFVVIYCSDKAQQCRNIKNEVSLLSQRLRKVDNVWVGQFNTEYNDLPGREFTRVPQVFLYPKGDKSNPIKYEGSYKGNDMLEWLFEKGPVVSQSEVVRQEVQKVQDKKMRDEERKQERKDRINSRKKRDEL